MIITSPSFQNNGTIPRKFTCEGGNINPEFQIQNVPPGAKSLAILMHDPDAPIPGGFTHWLVWNIRPDVMFIKEESAPSGSTEGTNGAGRTGYLGPCPSHGPALHHYHISLFALDAILSLPAAADRAAFDTAIKDHVIDETELVGVYALSRPATP
jgi:Raf kinase inhibitor-like YbhB/YbcL family protein